MNRPQVPRLVALALLLAAPPALASEGGIQIWPTGIHGTNPLEWRPWYLLALIATFFVLAPLMNRVLVGPLMRILEAREQRIEGSRERATTLAAEAKDLLERHREAVRQARELAAVDRRERVEAARAMHQQQVAEARGSAEDQIARSRSEVSAAVESARAELHRESEVLGREIAERLLGRSLV